MFFVFSLLTSPVPKPTPASVSEEPYKKDNGCKLSSHPLILMSLSHTYTLLLRILLHSDVISSPPPSSSSSTIDGLSYLQILVSLSSTL